MSEADVAQALEELQVIERVIADLQARLLAIQRSIIEHEEAIKLLEEMRRGGEKLRILFPLGAGAFAEANINSVDKVTVSLGAGVYAVKALEETQQLLSRRSQNLQAAYDSLAKRLTEYSSRAEELRSFIGRFLATQKTQGS